MSRNFIDTASALSEEALSHIAEALLAELEGALPEASRDAGEMESIGEAERLSRAVERLSAAVEKSGAAAETDEDRGVSPARMSEPRLSLLAAAAGGEAPDVGIETAGTLFPSAENGTAVPDLEDLSERIRRDSRRCDSGFERY